MPVGKRVADVQLSAWGLTAGGAWGSAQAKLQVDQPLTVYADVPVELTVGDELVVPIVVQNMLPVSQTVQITVTESPWFRMAERGADAQAIEVPAFEKGIASVPIQVSEAGEQIFELTYQGSDWTDTISHTTRVRPNGMWIARAYSWWIDDWVRYKFRVPWSAISGTDQVAVGLYPGSLSVLSAGFEAAVEKEGASLDEVAAALETGWLYSGWMKQQGQWAADQQAEWERGLALDYQNLLTFETDNGGFSAFGSPPADVYRSALALRCLARLAEAGVADEGTLDRTALWLLRQQSDDGAWQLARAPSSWSILANPELPVTAYIASSLIKAGYGDVPEVGLAIEYLEQYWDQSEDAYVLALVANALVDYGAQSDALEAALMRLAEQPDVIEGRLAYWPSGLQSLGGAVDGPAEANGYQTPSLRVETTALAVLALSRAGVYPGRVAEGLATLTDSRDVYGVWNAPVATTMALDAILAASSRDLGGAKEVAVDSTITVTVDGIAAKPVSVDGDEEWVLVFDQLSKGYNDVEIAVRGDEVAYQIVGSYFLPWGQVPPLTPEEEEVSIEVSYDRTSLQVGESITATVAVMLNRADDAPLVALSVGLAPGLDVIRADLDALVSSGKVAHYELAGKALLVYLYELSAAEPVQFSFRMRAKYPVTVLTQPTIAVDLANPQRPAVREPVEITVWEGDSAR
jgi:hypothetical protein